MKLPFSDSGDSFSEKISGALRFILLYINYFTLVMSKPLQARRCSSIRLDVLEEFNMPQYFKNKIENCYYYCRNYNWVGDDSGMFPCGGLLQEIFAWGLSLGHSGRNLDCESCLSGRGVIFVQKRDILFLSLFTRQC